MARPLISSLEPLEARIAPASLAVFHPLIDITPSQGKTGAVIDLANSFDQDPLAGYRTHVVFTTNFDTDPHTPGLQAGKIVLELFDDKAPLTVANFLSYFRQGGYAGTYFHRSDNSAATQILQGGQFIGAAPTTSIQASAEVHNEYDPNDTERHNVDGTIAMAKVGGDPNSATDGFFFNLGDNTSNLDSQNGGFTVFGKIVSGLDVAKAVAALPTTTIISGFGTPYQNGYQTDPDANPNTPAPTPTPSQLVEITGAQIVAPKQSSIAGLHYSLVSVIDESTGLSSRLITGAVSGNNLSLHYAPGASGIFDVTVQAKNSAGETVNESFHVNLTPNLISTGATDGFLGLLQIGDTAKETVKLTNTGAGTAHGFVTVNYYLSPTTSADSSTALDPLDIPVGSFTTATAISLASGKSMSISGNLTIPASAAQNLADGTYRLVGQISTSGDAVHTNLYTDDDLVHASLHQYVSGPRISDIAVRGIADSLNAILVPGDHGTAQVTIGDFSQTPAIGNVDVQLFLSSNASTAGNPIPEVLIGSLSSVGIHVAAGQSYNVAVPVAIPASLDVADGTYHVHAVITPSASGGVGNLNTSDDSALSSYNHALLNEFGRLQFGGVVRNHAVLKYADDAGNLVSLQLAGSGFGEALKDVGGGVSWYVDGNSAATVFSMGLTAADGSALPATTHTVVNDILVGSQSNMAIGTVSLGLADWTDAVTMAGGVTKLTVGNTSGSGDHAVIIGQPSTGTAVKPTVILGSLQDTSLTSSTPLASLTTGPWLSVNGDAESVQAPGIDTFHVKGDFTADLTITPAAATTAQVLKTFTVDGTLGGSTVQIGGNVGSVKLGAISGSDFLVGASFVPQALRDFQAAYSVAGFVVTGGNGTDTFGVTASNIAADRFTSLVLSSVNPDNDMHAFGVVAEKIATYQLGATVTKGLDATHPVSGDGDYSVRLLSSDSLS